MKSAYELAMERLNKQSPQSAPLSDSQKKQISEVDSLYRSKIAEKELFLKPKIEEAKFSGDQATTESLEKQFRDEVKALKEELENEKEKIRKSAS
jgi:hypothetical protein